MSYRNYNSLDRFRSDRNDDGEFDDFGFDRRRYGSGRYIRNDLDGSATLAMKRDNPDLVQFGNNAVPNCGKFQNCPPTYAPSNQQTKEMIGSYGIYCRRSNGGGGVGCPPSMANCEDDGGFSQDDNKPNSGYYSERMVVVNSARNGTTTNTIVEPDTSGKANDKFQWCCFNGTTGTEKIPSERNSHWYKSSVLLLLLAVVLAVVVLVSGLLLYFKFTNNYVTYKPRESLAEAPCEKKYCAYDAVCVLEPNGRPVCRCPSDCPMTDSPICGTDGVTYKNLCTLRSTACQNKLNIRVQHGGECHLSDPCRHHVCQYGARCVPTPDGRNVTCECPLSCPNYGDHTRSRPVCGGDGLDYTNHCELKRTACTSNANITVKYDGYCDPCSRSEVKCSEPEVCQLDPDRNPVCRCSETCSLEFAPVCGSDGKTYSNECSLRQQSCRSRKNLRIIHRGKCGSGVNPCSNVKCKSNEECIINKYGIAACECISDCEPIVRPVCGSDGVTYDSFCHLQQSSCRLKNNVSLAYNGVCGENGVCSNRHCNHGAQCVQRNGRASCECPTCTNEFDPVCGSDGVSYGNLCKLQYEECQHQRTIQVLYKGLCNGCENKKCEIYSTCESDGAGEAKCVCPTQCPEDTNTVCGSDSNTYPNECELKKHSCEIKELITISYKGNCDICQGVKCTNRTRCESGSGRCVCPSDCDKDLSISILDEPVCASDMNTYPNECEMQKHACIHSLATLSVLFYGDCKERIDASLLLEPVKETDNADMGNHLINLPVDKKEVCQDIMCDYEGTCEAGDGGPKCSCIFDCSREPEKPVCGSDFQMYSSLCHMKMKACQRQEEIRLRPIDLCQGLEVKPCNGKNPILDPVTGIELDCGSGPHRKDCPSDSYCHHTSKFARCCAKDTGVYIKSCHDSWYGCCPDEKTPAQGPENAGCPSMCNCNKLGSYSDACEPESGQCKCKPGVGGLKCDRCEPGYWGLPKISNSHPGCLPCGCSLFGSVRDDCEQMTGRCVCKPEVQGPKCTVCTDPNKVLGPNGCISADVSTPAPTSCNDLSCYFGATCEVHNNLAKCVCHITCPQDYNSQSQVVCGNDGQTYSSECQLKLYSCRYQKDIAVQALSSCTDDYISGTDGPKLGAWTSINQFTEPEEVAAPLSKSTRHILSPDPKNTAAFTTKLNNKSTSLRGDVDYNEISDMYHVINKPTSATITVMIGDVCVASDDCMIENSFCVGGICVCRSPFVEAADKQSCSEGITLAVKQRACSLNPCKNNAHCRDKSDVEFECVCLFPYTGRFCENSIIKREIEMPAFSGQSYLELKQLKAYHKFSVEIEFKTYTDNGILLYSQQRADGAGDFISLAIVNGYAEFRYNLGNGPAILTSMQRLRVNNFHKIVAKRYQRDGILQVDSNESVAGQSEGTLKALDLYDSAYIGYVPISSNKIFENIGISAGFVGCIKKLKIGRHIVKLKDRHDSIVQKVHDIKECTDLVKCENNTNLCNCIGGVCEVENNPCNSNPCQYGSICEPLLQGSYMCNCLPGYKGNSCEIFEPAADDLYIAQFNGINSYIKFPCLENVRRGFSIEMWFMTTSLNGLLLYNGQLHNRRGDFISVNLVNGFIQFRYDLGSGIANITTENQIELNSWQTVKIHRFDRLGSVQLNNGSIVKGMSGPSLNELNLELPLYVGGVPTLSEVSRESGVHDKFAGAIQRMLINGKSLQLLSGEHVNVVPYKSHICSKDDACLNGGICVPYLSTFYCKCLTNFSGTHCQNYTIVDNEVAVHFNGNMFLQYRHSNKHSYPELHVNFIDNTLTGDGLMVDETVVDPGSLDNVEDDTSDSDYDDDMYDDTSDFEFFNDEKKPKKVIQYEFAIRTTQTSGLLLWNSKIRHSQRDYVAISIVDGFIEFYHYFGKEQQVVALISEEMISDGKWHSVWIQHRKRITQIRIDSNKPAKLHSNNVQKVYLSNGKVFIGGVTNLPSNYPAKYSIGFRGCLKNLLIDRKRVSLAQLSHNTSTHIEYCQDNDI